MYPFIWLQVYPRLACVHAPPSELPQAGMVSCVSLLSACGDRGRGLLEMLASPTETHRAKTSAESTHAVSTWRSFSMDWCAVGLDKRKSVSEHIAWRGSHLL